MHNANGVAGCRRWHSCAGGDRTQRKVPDLICRHNLAEIAPFLGLAIGLAAYAKASGADGLIAHVFSGASA